MKTNSADYASYSRDSDYFFPDGTLCTAVEQKLFKVHSSVLSRHSTVFRDMLSVPSPPEPAGEHFEDVPVVTLKDQAKDVWVLLRLMYDPP